MNATRSIQRYQWICEWVDSRSWTIQRKQHIKKMAARKYIV